MTKAELFDSHCHLDSAELYADLDGVLARAEAAGVTRLCSIGTGRGVSEIARALELSRRHPGRIFATAAVHPHDAAAVTEADFEGLRRLFLTEPGLVAVGEIGLDYHYDHSPREVQRRVFRRFLAMAREVKRPVCIHTRAADEDTLAILGYEGAGELGGVIHCFSHSEEFGRAALALGFYLSIPGVLTFKKSEELRRAVLALPLSRMMLETDSPYLAPAPLRGKTNEPSFVVHTARRLAELKGVDYDEVARITTANARALYRVA